jgi:hypothetical protein
LLLDFDLGSCRRLGRHAELDKLLGVLLADEVLLQRVPVRRGDLADLAPAETRS